MRNPNGFGSIVKLSGKRRKPFLVRTAAVEIYNADTGKATLQRKTLGTFVTRKEAMEALAEYNHNPYDLDARKLTFADMYRLFYDAKYVNGSRQYSKSSMQAARTAFKNCTVLHAMRFIDIRKVHMQTVIDQCNLKHASLELIKNLFRQMYQFALENDFVDKDYSAFVSITKPDDDEKGVPFTDEELQLLWRNKDLPGVDTILIMIYSGYRISAFLDIKIDLEERFFQGGVKTMAGKDRIVPIHPAIYPFVEKYHDNTWLSSLPTYRRKIFYPTLESLGILLSSKNTKHTPHDCRHTFSWLCDKYHVDDLSKHLLMGHSLGNDVEKSVYGHRTIEELRAEIEKISIPEL